MSRFASAGGNRERVGSLRDRRVTGLAAILFFGWLVVILVTVDIILGPPSFSDTAATYRQYYTSNATTILVWTWVGFGAWTFGFLTFAAGLRGQFEGPGLGPGLWPRLMLVGATLAVAIGGGGAVFEAVLAAGMAREASDDLLRALAQMQEIAGTMVLPWARAMFRVAASVAILRTRSLGRGFAGFAIAAAGLMLAGALWPLTGDDQGALASVGLSGLGLCGVWVLAVGVSLLRRDRRHTGTHEVVDLEQPS